MIGRIGPVDVGHRDRAARPTPGSTATTGSRPGRPAASPCCAARLDLLDTVGATVAAAAPGSTRPPARTRRSCSARPPPQRLGIGAAGPASGLARRPVVHRRRHPRPGAARPRARLRRAGRLAGAPRRTSASTATRPPSTPGPRRPRSRRSGRCWRATANPEAPNEVEVSRPSDALAAQQAADARVHRAAARAGRGGAAGRRRRRGQHDGDLGAGTARRDRAAPLARAPPGGRSARSSSPSRCCCRRSAAPAACCSASR